MNRFAPADLNGKSITGTFTDAEYTSGTGDWAQEHYAYKVRIRYEGRSMAVTFRTGTGWKPNGITLENVLESLAMDYSYAEYVDTDDAAEFCKDMGYGEDSHEGRKIFRKLGKQIESLRRVFGSDVESFAETFRDQ